MKSIFATLALSLLAVPAFANIKIECGHGVKADQSGLEHVKFVIESDDGELSGPAGGTWHLYTSHSRNRELTKATLKTDRNKNLILSISTAASAGVGVQYILENPWGRETIQAKEKQIGGFAGGSETGQLDCVVFED